MTNSNSSNSPYILEMRNVSKTFPGVKALDQINLRVKRGSVHALMGENGAGNQKAMNEQASAILKELGVPMDVTEKMSDVSVAKAQLVAIATAVSNDAKVIIMDEPTTALTENEVDQLYRIIETVKARGIAIIFISHKLDEVFRVSDEITVIRDGQYVDTKPTKEVTKEQLISMMVGRDMSEMFQRERFELSVRLF